MYSYITSFMNDTWYILKKTNRPNKLFLNEIWCKQRRFCDEVHYVKNYFADDLFGSLFLFCWLVNRKFVLQITRISLTVPFGNVFFRFKSVSNIYLISNMKKVLLLEIDKFRIMFLLKQWWLNWNMLCDVSKIFCN